MKLFTTLVLATVVLRPPGAHAKGDAAGDLGSGGRVRGDISRTAGESDTITVTLDAGATLALRFTASFHAHLAVADPGGAAVDLGLADGARAAVTGYTVADAGPYTIAVSSADGSQGLYSLVVMQRWPRRLVVHGTGRQVVDVGMPAGAKLACVARGAAGGAARPEIAGVADPSDVSLLAAPVVATGTAAKLPPTSAVTAGVYHVTIDTTDSSSPWTATILRSVPRTQPASLALANGLDTVSFRGDGVGALFARRCSSCHGFASSYAAVRGNLAKILPRVMGRSMPPGGGLSDGEIALVVSWVKTGKAP